MHDDTSKGYTPCGRLIGMTSSHSSPMDITYATPHAAPHGSRVLAGAAITGAGLVLIGFGGCFMLGVMIQLSPQLVLGQAVAPKAWGQVDWVFHFVLYALAGSCFTAGGLLAWRGVNALFRVVSEKPTHA